MVEHSSDQCLPVSQPGNQRIDHRIQLKSRLHSLLLSEEPNDSHLEGIKEKRLEGEGEHNSEHTVLMM